MKKFAILMTVVMALSVILTSCNFTKDSGKVCDVLISPDQLENYTGRKATLLGSHEGVTVLNIDGKYVCVTQNGLYSSNINEGLFAQVRTRYQPNQYHIDTVPLGYSYSNMYSGMTGRIENIISSQDFGTGPVIVLDKTLEMVYKDSCTVLDDTNIGLLDGQTVKATGMWVPVGEEMQKYDPMMVLEYQGKNYCYHGYIQTYKTINVFGKPHHIYFEAGVWANYKPLIFGDTGVVSVEPRDGYYPDVYFDIGEGVREDDVDLMVEEIGSHGYLRTWYLKEQSWYGEILNDGKGNVYSLISWKDAPQLNPGYFASPKSYTYGGLIEEGIVMGEIEGKPLTVSLVDSHCEQVDREYSSSNFEVSLDGEVVGDGWGLPVEYYALIKGNGADQDIVYYMFDASSFCQK